MAQADEQQIAAVTALLRQVLGEGLAAVYLHGSAVGGGLHPQSDLDLLAVTEAVLTDAQRRALLAGLLALSGRHPARPGRPRPVEVTVFCRAALSGAGDPRAEFVYGEWLRDGFAGGAVPGPVADPDHLLVLAQARLGALPLLGPDPDRLLPAISPRRVRQAMRDALPALMAGLREDQRNTLLTLARMWHTTVTGAFAGKDAAAAWACARLDPPDAALLAAARRAYLGQIRDDWRGREAGVLRLAGTMRDRIAAALAQGPPPRRA